MNIALRLLHFLPPETAHRAAILALRSGLLPSSSRSRVAKLEQSLWGLRFASPLGMAAGFDKNAEAIDGLLAQGFGFVEAGTVTPRPQPGNPKPRMFRLRDDEAVINRMGFNNAGLDVFVRNLRARKNQGIVGANIGKNKETEDAAADYLTCLRAIYPACDYVTVNVSSPNTPGLRDLQRKEQLQALLRVLMAERDCLRGQTGLSRPLLVKLAPDLAPREREDIAEALLTGGVDGAIISNTTVSRPQTLRSPHAKEVGGLSGKPLLPLATETLRAFYDLTGGKLPLIGAGGVASAEDAYAKIRAGASLVQAYTAFAYQGFDLARRIHEGLASLLERDGFSSLKEAVGTVGK